MMYEGVKCYEEANKTIFMAHEIDEDKYNKYFNCGICLYGNFSYSKQHKRLNKNKCSVCFCIIEFVDKKNMKKNEDLIEYQLNRTRLSKA